MTTTITITDTDPRGVRAALGFTFSFWRHTQADIPANYTGVIIERISDGTAMLSTTDLPTGKEGVLTLNNTQFNALISLGKPSAAFVDFMESFVADFLRDHALRFERERKNAQSQTETW